MNDQSHIQRMLGGKGREAALGSNVPDADIEFALSSIWTARSLAYAAVT